MLKTDARLRERGRVEAANLAHALKTPAAILQNEIDKAEAGGRIDLSLAGEAVGRIADAAHRHLSRASAGPEDLPPRQVFDAVPVLTEIARAVRRLFPHLDLAVEAPDRLPLPVAAPDQQEIYGNLLENAGKWARSRVRVALSAEADKVAVTPESATKLGRSV